jgi:hypothetical protein
MSAFGTAARWLGYLCTIGTSIIYVEAHNYVVKRPRCWDHATRISLPVCSYESHFPYAAGGARSADTSCHVRRKHLPYSAPMKPPDCATLVSQRHPRRLSV